MVRVGLIVEDYTVGKGWVGFFNSPRYKDKIEIRLITPRLKTRESSLLKNKKERFPEVDVVFFDGGADVHPAYYGEQIHEKTVANPVRDWAEHIVFKHYWRTNAVFAGICRGSQFLNVMCGGDLHQDLLSIKKAHDKIHELKIEKESSLYKVLDEDLEDTDLFDANSYHHQAVNELGEGLTPILIEPETGIIEGYESDRIRAVQSHPEYPDKEYILRMKVCDWLFRCEE